MRFQQLVYYFQALLQWLGFITTLVVEVSRTYFQHGVPKPCGIFPLGNILEFIHVFGPNAHRWLMKRHRQYGPVYQFQSVGKRMVFLFKFRDLLTLRKAEGRYPEHFEFNHLRLYRKQRALPFGLLVSTGEEWGRQRRCIGKAMLGTCSINAYYPRINKVAIETISSMNLMTDKPLEMDGIVSTYVLQAMSQVILGNENLATQDLKQIIEIAGSNFADAKILLSLPAFVWPLLPAWKRHGARWDRLLQITKRYITEFVDESTDGERNPSVLRELLYNTDLTMAEVHINVTDLILASIDTTTSTMLWVLHEISRHPSVQRKLNEEFKMVTGSSLSITYDELQNLNYLRAVLKESQRLHPVGFFASRYIQQDISVNNFCIKKGSHVAASMYVIGRDEDIFNQSNTFQPERWLTSTPEMDDFYQHVPFGFGKRMCIGKRIAEGVILSFLYYLLRFNTLDSMDQEPVDPIFRIIMVPGKPIVLTLKSKQDNTNTFRNSNRKYH